MHSRSAELVYVDDALGEYEASPEPKTLWKLKYFLEAWSAGKVKTKKNGRQELSTIRDHKGAVTDLLRVLRAATQLHNPTPTRFQGIFIGNDLFRGDHWVCDGFKGKAETALAVINSRPVGRQLLAEISAKCRLDPTKQVVIEYSGGSSNAGPVEVMTNDNRLLVQSNHWSMFAGVERPSVHAVMSNPALVVTWTPGVYRVGETRDYIPGAGTGAVCSWNATFPGYEGNIRPTFVALAHELVHAHHYTHGSCYRAVTGLAQDGENHGLMEEEMRTVGFGRYANEALSENSIREEHGEPRRTNYIHGQNWNNVVATIFGP
jgi:hypothetical protein